MKEKHCYNCTYVREMNGELVCRTVTGSMANLPNVLCCARYEEGKNRTPSPQAQMNSAVKDNPSTYGAKFKILDEVSVEGVDEIGTIGKIRPDEKYGFCYYVMYPNCRSEWTAERVMSLYEQPKAKPELVNHPDHYNSGGIECIDAILAARGSEATKEFCICNTMKYLWRLGHKDDAVQEAKKARWYLDKYIELCQE